MAQQLDQLVALANLGKRSLSKDCIWTVPSLRMKYNGLVLTEDSHSTLGRSQTTRRYCMDTPAAHETCRRAAEFPNGNFALQRPIGVAVFGSTRGDLEA